LASAPALGASTVQVMPALRASRSAFLPATVISVREPEISASKVLPPSTVRTIWRAPFFSSATVPFCPAAAVLAAGAGVVIAVFSVAMVSGDWFRASATAFATSSP
jgi:hypothetical protein